MKWSDSRNRQLYLGGEAYGSQLLSYLFATLADQEIAKSIIIIINNLELTLSRVRLPIEPVLLALCKQCVGLALGIHIGPLVSWPQTPSMNVSLSEKIICAY